VIKPGQTIEHPVTGERMTFLKTSAETNGEYVLVELELDPGGFVAAPHVHPYQEETFEILEGRVGFKAGDREWVAVPGAVVTVPRGTPHKFWNAGDETARFRTEVRPALRFEQLIETMFTLAQDGKVNRKGMPNPLRLAVIAKAHFDDVRLPFPPVWMQRAGLALGAPLGRLLGYGAVYVPAEGAAAAQPAS
jgi:quercetin dioxygenase-like cupin family protein